MKYTLPKTEPLACDYEGSMIYGYTAEHMQAAFSAGRVAGVEAAAKACEPVAWMREDSQWVTDSKSVMEHHKEKGMKFVPLYK